MDQLLSSFKLKESDNPKDIQRKLTLLQTLCEEMDMNREEMKQTSSQNSEDIRLPVNVQKLIEENRRLHSEIKKLMNENKKLRSMLK